MNRLSLTFLVLLLFPAYVLGREQLHFKYIDGAICLQSVIKNGENAMNAHLIVDLGLKQDLLLHQDATDLLEIQPEQQLTIETARASLESLEVITSSLDEIDRFSKKNAQALGDIPVWGFLGSEAFDVPAIMLDIQNRLIEYGDFEIPEGHTLNTTVSEGRMVSKIEPDPGYTIQAMIATGHYDCIFDADTAALAGSENGDFENCRFAGLNLREYTSVRVENDFSSQLIRVDCLIANNFWQNFIVYQDIKNSKLVLVDHPNGMISDLNEQLFYNALIEKDSKSIEEYLDQHSQSRLVDEACDVLLKMAVESSDNDVIEAAIDRLTGEQSPKESAATLLGYALEAIEGNEFDISAFFLESAKKQVLKTEDAPLLRGRIDAYCGFIALEKNQMATARRQLLSALFINPQDGYVNYLMGRYYQLNSEPVRAWARFLKASLAEESYEQALGMLQSLDQNNSFREQFSIEDACDFLEGHITDEDGNLTQQALLLKIRGGDLIKSAIEQLQEQR